MKINVIFDNHDTTEIENDIRDERGTDADIYDFVNYYCIDWWEDELEAMCKYFDNLNALIAVGTIGRWNGNFKAGTIWEHGFKKLIGEILKDCDTWKFWEEKDHFYVGGWHHDGYVEFEIKELTPKGEEYHSNWEYNWNDTRTEEEVNDKIMKDSHYSRLPKFWKNVYGK